MLVDSRLVDQSCYDCQVVVGPVLVECRSSVDQDVASGVPVECQWIIGQVSVNYWSSFRGMSVKFGLYSDQVWVCAAVQMLL